MSPSSPNKKSSWGVVWKHDRARLYRFTDSSVSVIQPWPAVLCWQRHGGMEWRGAWPTIRLDLVGGGTTVPYPYRFEHEAWSTIPEEVRAAVLRGSFAVRQWATLCLISRCRGGARLVDEQPLLAAAAANVGLMRSAVGLQRPTQPWRDLRAALRGPRSRDHHRRIARVLRWPECRSFLRVLHRVGPLAPESWEASDVAALPLLWAEPQLRKVLQHGPPLTPGRLILLRAAFALSRRGAGLPTPLLLATLDEHTAGNLASATHGLAAACERRPDLPPPSPCSLTSLEAIERATLARFAAHGVDTPLPAPPLPGTAHIVPLKTEAALVLEGQRMNHCIGTHGFADRARAHAGYGYAVCDPTSGRRVATAWIEPSTEVVGAFTLGQLQGPGNAAVPRAIRAMVVQWLRLGVAACGGLALTSPSQPSPRESPSHGSPLHPDWAPPRQATVQTWQAVLAERGRRRWQHMAPVVVEARVRGRMDADIPF